MGNNSKIYLISFGDSDKYRIPFDGTLEQLEKSSLISTVRSEIESFVKSKIKSGSEVKTYALPQIREVSKDDKDIEQYRLFDSSAIQEIKNMILSEVQDMDSLRELNRNAPFDDDLSTDDFPEGNPSCGCCHH